MEIVSLKMTAICDDGSGRLFPSDLPCMLVPPCSNCFAPAVDGNCETCRLSYCPSCTHTCENWNLKTPSENTPRTIVSECQSGDSGSTKELVVTILPSFYEQLKGNDYVPLEDETILAKANIPLGEVLIQDEFVERYFGTCLIDFKLLCRSACCDYPEGMVILNVDHERALVLACNCCYEPQYVGWYEAIKWFKKAKGAAIGLVVSKGHQDKVACELFEVLEEDEDFDPASKSEHLLSLVCSRG